MPPSQQWPLPLVRYKSLSATPETQLAGRVSPKAVGVGPVELVARPLRCFLKFQEVPSGLFLMVVGRHGLRFLTQSVIQVWFTLRAGV